MRRSFAPLFWTQHQAPPTHVGDCSVPVREAPTRRHGSSCGRAGTVTEVVIKRHRVVDRCVLFAAKVPRVVRHGTGKRGHECYIPIPHLHREKNVIVMTVIMLEWTGSQP